MSDIDRDDVVTVLDLLVEVARVIDDVIDYDKHSNPTVSDDDAARIDDLRDTLRPLISRTGPGSDGIGGAVDRLAYAVGWIAP